eukprot:941662_1
MANQTGSELLGHKMMRWEEFDKKISFEFNGWTSSVQRYRQQASFYIIIIERLGACATTLQALRLEYCRIESLSLSVLKDYHQREKCVWRLSRPLIHVLVHN